MSIRYTIDGDIIPADDRIDDIQRETRARDRARSREIEEIEDRLAIVEQQFCILNRDLDYERKHPELRKAYNEYNRILEKYKTFNILADEQS